MKELDVPACGAVGLIDDGEDGDNRILQRDGRGGYWFSFVGLRRARRSSRRVRSRWARPASTARSARRACAARWRRRARASTPAWAFSSPIPSGPYDASPYTGVTFWAKGPGRVRFEMPDVNTAPGGGRCKDCYNDVGIVIALEPEWRKYTIHFEWLAQRPGWGDPAPELASDQVYAMEWEFNGAGRDFDISIDDIAFICEPEEQ